MPRRWVLRPVLWFAAASIATTILHELAHACVAFSLGVRSTLFSYWADLDLTPAQAASELPLFIRIAGPLFSLVSGALCFLAYRRSRGASLRVPPQRSISGPDESLRVRCLRASRR